MSMAKRKEACRSRAEERLMGPAIDRPHLSLADAKGDAGQVGNTAGFSIRHAFQDRGRGAGVRCGWLGVLRQGIHVTREREMNRDVMIRAP